MVNWIQLVQPPASWFAAATAAAVAGLACNVPSPPSPPPSPPPPGATALKPTVPAGGGPLAGASSSSSSSDDSPAFSSSSSSDPLPPFFPPQHEKNPQHPPPLFFFFSFSLSPASFFLLPQQLKHLPKHPHLPPVAQQPGFFFLSPSSASLSLSLSSSLLDSFTGSLPLPLPPFEGGLFLGGGAFFRRKRPGHPSHTQQLSDKCSRSSENIDPQL
jgi:hypothetical protein